MATSCAAFRFLIVVVISCGSSQPPPRPAPLELWSRSAHLDAMYPLRGTTCGASGKVIQTDLRASHEGKLSAWPVVVTVTDQKLDVRAPIDEVLTDTDAPLIRSGGEVIDEDSGERATLPTGPESGIVLWRKAAMSPTFLRVQRLEPTGASERSKLVVFGAHTWTLEVRGWIRNAKLSPTGSSLAILLRAERDGETMQLVIFDGAGNETGRLALGGFDDFLTFDETGSRVAVATQDNGPVRVVVASTTGTVLFDVPLAESGALSTPGSGGAWASFRGDELWAFASHWRGNHDGGREASGCSYVHVALPPGGRPIVATEADAPAFFGRSGTCNVQVLCPVTGGVLEVNHGPGTITVTMLAGPP